MTTASQIELRGKVQVAYAYYDAVCRRTTRASCEWSAAVLKLAKASAVAESAAEEVGRLRAELDLFVEEAQNALAVCEGLWSPKE